MTTSVNTWANPSGRRALNVLGVTAILVVISNISATAFWHLNGGVGLLDLDGAANLLQPAVAHPVPAPGSPARIEAVLALYTPAARFVHVLLLCTLDLVFPPLLGFAGWTTIAWASRSMKTRWRTGARLLGAALAVAYPCADWSENMTELLLLSGYRGAAVDVLPHLTTAKLNALIVMAVVAITTVTAQTVLRHQPGGTSPAPSPHL